MKIKESNSYIIVVFSNREKEWGLTNYLEKEMPFLGVNFSEDKLTWQIDVDNIEKFYRLIKKFENKNRQISLF
jgi:hypothetical protein